MQIRNISAFVREIPQDDSRTAEFVISDSSKDRHNTVINSDGWLLDNYMKNPIVGYNHNVYGRGLFVKPSPDDVIGKSEIFKDGNKLIGRVTFEPAEINKTAEKIYQKIKFGTLRAASVGFIEVGKGKFGENDQGEGKQNQTYYFQGQELLEWSVVNIPSNPFAVKRNDYSEPSLDEILNKYSELIKTLDEKELRKVSIIDFLKSMEGIIELKIPEKIITEKLSELYEKKLHILSIPAL